MTRYLTFRDLVERGRFNNRMTLDRHIKAGLFPAPVRIGANSVRWDEAEAALYDRALKAARDAGVDGHAELVDFVRRFVSEHAAELEAA